MSNTHYESVLADLRGKKAEYQERISLYQKAMNEVDGLIVGIQRHLGEAAEAYKSIVFLDPPATTGPFTGMSLKKAIYYVLFWKGNMRTGEIASSLQLGGITSGAANFNGNVSATLSEAKKREEVELTGDKWSLSDMARMNVSTWLANEVPNVRIALEELLHGEAVDPLDNDAI